MTILPTRQAALPTWTRAAVLFVALASTLGAANNYLVHNLVSDLPDVADHVDKNLVNPWGNGFSGGSPFWIGNNGTGTSTLYDGEGNAISLVVKIPAGGGAATPGPVTGVIFNSASPSFTVATGKAASFLFCTADGTISGWNSSAKLGQRRDHGGQFESWVSPYHGLRVRRHVHRAAAVCSPISASEKSPYGTET